MKFILVCDTLNNLIRIVDLSTITVSTLIGNGNPSSIDGIGTMATIHSPFDVSISDDNNWAVITDGRGHRIRKLILSTREITTLTGSQGCFTNTTSSSNSIKNCQSLDGIGTAATLSSPFGIVLSSSTNQFIIFSVIYNHKIRKYTFSDNMVTTI